MKRIMPIVLVFALLMTVAAVLDGCKKVDMAEQTIITEYDLLQQIFIDISDSTTEDDIKSAIAENDLHYEREEYRDATAYTIGIEYEEGERHPFKGDTIDISFGIEDGSIDHAVYTHGGVSAIFYCAGTYWDLHDGSEIGYYGDIIGKHNYEKVESAEDAIQYVFDHQR